MLTALEESVLKKIAQDHIPMRVQNPRNETGYRPSKMNFYDTLIDQLRALPKLRVANLNDDPVIESRLRSAGFKSKPGVIFSLGVSRQEILSLSASELRERVRAAEARDAEQGLVRPNASLRFEQQAKQPAPLRSILVG